LNIAYIVILFIMSAIVLVTMAWRFAAKRFRLPCPPFLIPLIENPYIEAVAGPKELMDRAGVEEGMDVLDAGCGPGRLTIPLAERVGNSGSVTALDVQCEMLRRVISRIEKRDLTNVRLVHSCLGRGTLGKNRFDRAFLVTVLGEVPERKEALREIYDSLKPGGILSITEVFPDPHFLRKSTVRKLAEEAGFRLIETFGCFPSYTMNFGRGNSRESNVGP